MKKILIAAAVLITSTFTAFTANAGDKVNAKVLSTFQKEFSQATDVKWTITDDVVKANFSYLGTRAEAFFTTEGELMGTARNVLYNQLPIAITRELDKKYASATIYDIIEYSVGGETKYSMTIELVSKKLTVKATSGGEIWVEAKMKK